MSVICVTGVTAFNINELCFILMSLYMTRNQESVLCTYLQYFQASMIEWMYQWEGGCLDWRHSLGMKDLYTIPLKRICFYFFLKIF